MEDHNEQDAILDFEAYELDGFSKQDGDVYDNDDENYSKQRNTDDMKQRKVKVEFKKEVIRFNPNDTIALGNVVITSETKVDSKKSDLGNSSSQIPLSKEEGGEFGYKNSQKVKKLQSEYVEYQETQQALKEFQDKEYQFRFIIDNFVQLNIEKQHQLEQSKQSLIKIQNNRYVAVDKSDPLLHVNNNNNLRSFANKRISKLDEDYPQEVESVLKELKGRIEKQVDKVKEEQFYTKTLSFMEQRLILQKEEVQKLLLEYEQLNEAVEKNITYLEEDEKEIKAENVLNICKQQYTKKAMNHIEDIHKTVMQKTMHLQQRAESDLKSEIHSYKDIKESLVEAREALKETERQIEQLGHENIIKLRQQQELDSLIDHLSNFNMLANVFIYDDPKRHFTNQLSFELEEEEIQTNDQNLKGKNAVPNSSTKSMNFDEKRDTPNPFSYDGSMKQTLKILKQKNLMLYALKVKKKLTEIKNELDGDEIKAQFIVNILNQFYDAHQNNIPFLFEQLEISYQNSCKQGDNLSGKVVQLEIDKKKYSEELNELKKEVLEIKEKFQKKKKNLEIIEVDQELDLNSYNLIISNYYSSDKFIENYYNNQNSNSTDIYTLLKDNEMPQQSAFAEEKDAFSKNYHTFLIASNIILLNQIRDRGDAQNGELNDLVDESLMFLRGWKVQSKEIDTNSRYLIIQEIKQLNLNYILDNIIAEQNLLDCLTIDLGGSDCLFGILKIFEKVFRDRTTLKQICERVITEQSKKLKNNKEEISRLRENIESVYHTSKEVSLKRCKCYFLEMLESDCFIWKYVTKGQLAKYINDVKQQYDQDLEECLMSSQDFKEGNQKINIDENHVITLLQQNYNFLYEKANTRAKEWIFDIMSLFKKVLMVVLKRKMILSKQLGLIDEYDEEGVLHPWYDPVSAFNSKRFDNKLNNVLTQVQNQKSSKLSLYLGKQFESTADTFQCISLDTQIPVRTNCKSNIFNLVKQQVDYIDIEEDFINIKTDLMSFEGDRQQIKKIISQIYRPLSSKRSDERDGNDSTPISISVSGITNMTVELGLKKQRPFSAARGEQGYTNNDFRISGQIQQSSSKSRIIQGGNNQHNGKSIKESEKAQPILNLKGKGHSQQKKQFKREGGVSSAGEDTAASMEDLTSGEYDKKQIELRNNKNSSPNQNMNPILGFALNGSNDVKKKIMQELTKEIKTVEKEVHKQLIQSERNNIVHQQSEYRKTRDLYIKEKKFDECHSKLQEEIQNQILFMQQQNQSVPITNQVISQMNAQMQSLQSQFQRTQINTHKSIPIKFKKKQSAAVESLQQQQSQLQQLQAAATAGQATTQGFLSGTSSQNANKRSNQANPTHINHSKGKKKRHVMLDIMKEKWETIQIQKQKSLQKSYAYIERFKEKDDQKQELNATMTSISDPTNQKNKQNMVQNKDNLAPKKFEAVISQIIDNGLASPKKQKFETGLNQEQITKIKRENLFLQHLERESLQQQFIKLNHQLSLQERFNKIDTNVQSPNNPSEQQNTHTNSFQNTVRTVKITNTQNLSNQVNSSNTALPPRASSSYNSKRSFQIRSLSPNSNNEQNSKTGIYFDNNGPLNKNKTFEHSKLKNNSQSRLLTQQANKSDKLKLFTQINRSEDKVIQRTEENKSTSSPRYASPYQQYNKGRNSKSSELKFRTDQSSSTNNQSSSSLELNEQQKLMNDLNRYYNKNNYF